ncbi:hypothetical protein ABC977_08400 [Thioalkalicoccus limnaeus]|uniref:Uncharacterized protein n=1 Tax=Thioalkalicoccus limnaeus TaxID=120681 RepID=A0ABV4BD88_9GAMM
MVLGTGGGEDRLFDTPEEDLDQSIVMAMTGQQGLTPVVACRMTIERAGVREADPTRFAQGLGGQSEALDELVDGPQQGARHVVRIDLIARQHQQGGPRRQWVRVPLPRFARVCDGSGGEAAGEQPVGLHQPVAVVVVGLAAGAVQQRADACREHEPRRSPARMAEPRRPIPPALPGQLRAAQGLQQQLVADPAVRREGLGQAQLDQEVMQVGTGAHEPAARVPRLQCMDPRGAFTRLELEAHAHRLTDGEPQHQGIGRQTAEDGASDDQRQDGRHRGPQASEIVG